MGTVRTAQTHYLEIFACSAFMKSLQQQKTKGNYFLILCKYCIGELSSAEPK